MLCCLALKKLYESYDASNDEFSNLVYHTVVSLRDGQRTGQGSFGENVMGLITGGLLTHPDTSAINRILENRDGLSELFWPLAKKWSNEMHNRLKNDPTRYFVKVNPPSKEEMNFHFTTSNMGVHFSSEDSDLEYFRFEIKKLASYPTSNKSANSRMFIIWICVYLDNLCFGLNFNSHFVDVSMMERYLNIFKSLLDELAKKETIQSNI